MGKHCMSTCLSVYSLCEAVTKKLSQFQGKIKNTVIQDIHRAAYYFNLQCNCILIILNIHNQIQSTFSQGQCKILELMIPQTP